MVLENKKLLVLLGFLVFGVFVSLTYVSALEFNGTVYDINGYALNASNISVLVRTSAWAQYWQNYSTSNASGWFNITLPGNASDNYFYQVSVTYENRSFNTPFVQYVGQSLPAFPFSEMSALSGINFYLKEAGTINITVINSSGENLTSFAYQVKDTNLGFPVGTCTQNSVLTQAICHVPKDRNYSIMVYPGGAAQTNFVPVSFDWNNFSSTSSYNLTSQDGNNLSFYNHTTGILQKQFNITQKFAKITGSIWGDGLGGKNWSEFTVVPFLTESGNMVFINYGTLPWNASSWDASQSDFYNLTSGEFNITVPYTPAETVRYILFATAKNGSAYYGGYRNISVSGDLNVNFTMYGLLGGNSNISMDNAAGGAKYQANTSRQVFTFVNVTNHTISNEQMHVEVTVDYTNYNATEFTFIEEISQTGNANISLPLLNVTGVKEINIYSMNRAPKRVDTMTVSDIISNTNITMKSFNPGDISGALTNNQISISIYRSNSTCDVPTPAPGCVLTSSTNMASFKPISAIMGGGAVSFRMGTGNINIHYVNVDMLASGPPDGLFDNDAGVSESSSSFANALRFGSAGPKIYDYVLVSIPYSESGGTGLNDSQQVNASIPTFYDENWNVIWDSTNGTNASALAGNHSHYSGRETEWQTLMTSRACGSWIPNATDPCHINTTSNKIWLRIPHFSGTGPSISGALMASASTSSTSSTSSSSGTSSNATGITWKNTHILTDEQFIEGYTRQLGAQNRMRVKVDGEDHHIGVINLTETSAKIEISSTPVTIELDVGEDAKVDVSDDRYYDIYIKLEGIADNKADVFVQSIHEEIPEDVESNVATTGEILEGEPELPFEEEGLPGWLIILIILIVLVVLVGGGVAVKKRRRQ